MDKHILFVKSDIPSTKSDKNKDLVSFHKQPRICFNFTTLAKVGIKPNMWCKFTNVDFEKRVITLRITNERLYSDRKSDYCKVTNPKVDNRNTYCYIRTTNLLHKHDIICYGAFEYDVMKVDTNWLIFIKF